MRAFLARHRAFLIASAAAAVALAAAGAIASVWGEDLVRAGNEGRLAGWWNRLCHQGTPGAFSLVLRDVRERFVGGMACAVGLWTLVAAVYAGARSARPFLWVPLGALAAWVAFETWAPPLVERLFWLGHYEYILDVDHIPPRQGRAWNSDSLRGTDEPETFRPEELNLVFLGDSFTYGFKLAPEESFPARVGEILRQALPDRNVHVANFGWSSSSPLLSLRRLRSIGAKYSPDLVVLSIDMTDFADDLRYQGMLDRRGLYWLYDKLPISIKIFQVLSPDGYKRFLSMTLGGTPVERFFVTEAPLEETRRWIEPLVANVGRIREWCREHGAEFVLVVLPRSYQYSDRESPENWEAERYTVLGPYAHEPFRYFEELAPRVDYPIVSLLPVFQTTDVFPTCFVDDPHWTKEGAEVAARAIAEALRPML